MMRVPVTRRSAINHHEAPLTTKHDSSLATPPIVLFRLAFGAPLLVPIRDSAMADEASKLPLAQAFFGVYEIDTATAFASGGKPKLLSGKAEGVVDDLTKAMQVLQQQTKDKALCALVDAFHEKIKRMYAEVSVARMP